MGDFLGAIVGGVTAAGQTVANAVLAKQTREWQEKMRNTAYQSTVKDLRRAGLNPALAFGGGSVHPAAVPQGPTAQVADFSGAIERGISSVRQMRANKDELARIKADREMAQANADVAGMTTTMRAKLPEVEVRRGLAEINLLGKQAEQSEAQRMSIDVNRALSEAEIPSARARAAFDSTEFGQLIQAVQRTLGAIPSLSGNFSTGASRAAGDRGQWGSRSDHSSGGISIRGR